MKIFYYLCCILFCFLPAYGQISQKTLGSCSPTIAGVFGNVDVTCITEQKRIHIARFVGAASNNNKKAFINFLEKNLGQIIYIDANFDENDYQEQENSKDENSPAYLKLADCIKVDGSEACGGNIVYFNEFYKQSTAYWSHGEWKAEGYYIVGGGGGGQGWTEYALRPVDRKEIILSDKYEND